MNYIDIKMLSALINHNHNLYNSKLFPLAVRYTLYAIILASLLSTFYSLLSTLYLLPHRPPHLPAVFFYPKYPVTESGT